MPQGRRNYDDPCHFFLASSEANIFIYIDVQSFTETYKSILLMWLQALQIKNIVRTNITFYQLCTSCLSTPLTTLLY